MASNDENNTGTRTILKKPSIFFFEENSAKKAGIKIRGKVFTPIPNPNNKADHCHLFLSYANITKARNTRKVGIISNCPSTVETAINTGEKANRDAMFCFSRPIL